MARTAALFAVGLLEPQGFLQVVVEIVGFLADITEEAVIGGEFTEAVHMHALEQFLGVIPQRIPQLRVDATEQFASLGAP